MTLAVDAVQGVLFDGLVGELRDQHAKDAWKTDQEMVSSSYYPTSEGFFLLLPYQRIGEFEMTYHDSPPPAQIASSVWPRSSLRVVCAAVVTLAVTMALVGPARPSEAQTVPNCGLNAVTVDGTAAVLAGDTYTGSVSADSFTVNVSFTDSEDRYVYVNLHTGIQREYLAKLDNSGRFTFDVAAYTAKLREIPLWLQIPKGGDNQFVKHYNHVNQTVRYMSKADWYAKCKAKVLRHGQPRPLRLPRVKRRWHAQQKRGPA